MLIDVVIAGGRNVIKKGAEKIFKYTNLITESQRMCNLKANVIATIIRVTVPTCLTVNRSVFF